MVKDQKDRLIDQAEIAEEIKDKQAELEKTKKIMIEIIYTGQ